MKNNMSTGIDIVSIDRIKEILTSSKRERFLKKIFSPNEIKDFGKENHVIYDIKYLLSADDVDGRL